MEKSFRSVLSVLAFALLAAPAYSLAGDDTWTAIRAEGGYAEFVEDGGTLYLYSDERIYVSTTGADSWNLLAELPSHISDLVTDGDLMLAATSHHGVMRSVDGGESWTTAGLDFGEHWTNDVPVSDIEFSNDAQGTIYAGTYGAGVFVSVDDGASWSATGGTPGNGHIGVITTDPGDPNRVYSGTLGTGLYSTMDGGDNWTLHDVGIPADSRITVVEFSPLTPQDVFAGGDASWDVYKSSDGGTSWTVLNNVPGNGLPTHTATLRGIAFDASGDTVYAAFEAYSELEPLYVSTDNGSSWAAHKPDDTKDGPNAFDVLVQGDGTVIVGTSRGVYQVSADGVSWTQSNEGFDNVPLQHVAIAPDESGLMIGVGRNMYPYRSTDNGATWKEGADALEAPDYLSVAFNPVNSDEVWLGQAFGEGLLKSTDGGINWTAQDLTTMEYSHMLSHIAVNPLDPDNVIAINSGDHVAHITTDGGITWQKSTEGLPDQNMSPYATDLLLDPADPKIVYLATPLGLFRSVDGGFAWTEINVTGETGESVTALAIDPDDHNVVYAGVWQDSIYRTEDGGSTWQPLDGSPYARQIAIDPNDGTRLLAASDDGLSSSIDGGETWFDFTRGIPASPANTRVATDLQFHPVVENRYYVIVDDVLYVRDGALESTADSPDDNDDGEAPPPTDQPESGGGGGGAPGIGLLFSLLGLLVTRKRVK